jgi:hypothetical protein
MVSRLDSPVSVQIEGDGLAYLSEGLQLMDRVMARRSVGGLTMLKGYQPLGNGTYAYAISAGGVNIVRVVSPPQPTTSDEAETVTITPDFYSGVVDQSIIEQLQVGNSKVNFCTEFDPTPDCARLFKISGDPQAVTKLAVLIFPGFSPELAAPEGAIFQYTQYTKLKPTMYSGTMRKCVQLLMGFGLQDKKSIYDSVVLTSTDDSDDGDISESVAPPITPYEASVKTNGRQILYDYRWFRTTGLTQASDGTWWLVEVGMTRGIIAMPLPVHASTTTPAFVQQLTTMNDPAGLAAVDLFQGFPTGEDFPVNDAAVEAWIRAGKLLRSATDVDMSEFYSHVFYSSAMGWAFNSRGNEIHNTAYDFDDGDGIQRGYHYKLEFHIVVSPPVPVNASGIALQGTFAPVASDNSDTFDANMYKLGRLTNEQIAIVVDAITNSDVPTAYTVLDALVAAPLGTATGKPVIVNIGKIWWPTVIQPQIKFAEPLLGYMLSHDMRTDFRFYAVGPQCDTIMHVFFKDDELRWCKYFLDPRTTSTVRTGDDPYDVANNPLGDFSEVYTTGPASIPAMFYTSDFDDRADVGASSTTNKYHRTDGGWMGIYAGGTSASLPSGFDNGYGPLDPDFTDGGDEELHKLEICKLRRFYYHSLSQIRSGPGLGAAISVPFFDREAYYYALMTSHAGGQDITTDSQGYVGSPWIGHYDRALGFLEPPGADPHDLLLDPQYHTVNNPNQPSQHFQDLADEGDWVPHGADVRTIGVQPLLPTSVPVTVIASIPAVKTLQVSLLSANPITPVPTYTETRTGSAASLWDSFWFLPSPDPDTELTAYIQETGNSFGPDDCLVYQRTINDPAPSVVLGFPSHPKMTQGDVCFVGVV